MADPILRRSAERYAEHGFYVFRLRDGSKKPLRPGWQDEATADPERVRKLWERSPDANVGVLTGPETGTVVLDEDPRAGGRELVEKLKRGWGGDWYRTLTVRTGGEDGGRHFYLRAEPGMEVPNAAYQGSEGLRLKSSGQYVVGAGSIHPDTGNRYKVEWPARPLRPIPSWMPHLFSQNGSEPESEGDADNGWISTLLREGVEEPGRNEAISALARYLARQGIPVDVAIGILKRLNPVICRPPIDESDPEEKSIADTVRSNYRTIRGRHEGEKLDPEVWIASDLVRADIPDPGWAAEGFLPLEDVGVIAALFDTGKTWVQLQSAIDLWQERPLFDRFPVLNPLRSLIIMGEGTPKGTQKRLLTLCRGAGADPTDLDGVHIVHDLRAKLGDANLDAFLRKYIQEHGIDVLWMDPFSEFLAGSEGDDEDLKAAIRPLRAIRDDLGTTVVLVHHARQPSDQDIGKPAGVLWRGRTNLPDWADIGYTLKGPGRSDIRVEKAKSRNVALEEEEYTLRWVEGETEEGDTLRLVHEAESEIISGGYDLSEAQERAVEEIRRTLVNHGPDSVSFYTGKSSRKGGPRGWSEALEKALDHLEETRDVYVDREYRYDGRQHTVMWFREALERGYVDGSDLQSDAFEDTATVRGPS